MEANCVLGITSRRRALFGACHACATALLVIWGLLVAATLITLGRGVLGMFYIEWTPVAQQRVEAHGITLTIGAAIAILLGVAALALDAKWWEALMVASPGLILAEYPFVQHSFGAMLLIFAATAVICAFGSISIIRRRLRETAPLDGGPAAS